MESSRRNLHNALLCTVLQSQFFRQKSPKLFRDWINEYSLIQSQTIRILHFFCEFLMNFFRISRQIPENSDVCRFFNQICENKSDICRKFWILWKKTHYFSKLFTSLLTLDGGVPPRSRRSQPGRPSCANLTRRTGTLGREGGCSFTLKNVFCRSACYEPSNHCITNHYIGKVTQSKQ